jgi:Stress responsive A/B Barrel Domain
MLGYMICHVWMMSMKSGVTAVQRKALLEGMAKLPAEIDGIVSFKSGEDLGLSSENADIVIIAEFENEQSWRTYLEAPAHQRLAVRLVDPVYGNGSAIQISVARPV